MASQRSRLSAQSGPMSMSLVAFSTMDDADMMTQLERWWKLDDSVGCGLRGARQACKTRSPCPITNPGGAPCGDDSMTCDDMRHKSRDWGCGAHLLLLHLACGTPQQLLQPFPERPPRPTRPPRDSNTFLDLVGRASAQQYHPRSSCLVDSGGFLCNGGFGYPGMRPGNY